MTQHRWKCLIGLLTWRIIRSSTIGVILLRNGWFWLELLRARLRCVLHCSRYFVKLDCELGYCYENAEWILHPPDWVVAFYFCICRSQGPTFILYVPFFLFGNDKLCRTNSMYMYSSLLQHACTYSALNTTSLGCENEVDLEISDYVYREVFSKLSRYSPPFLCYLIEYLHYKAPKYRTPSSHQGWEPKYQNHYQPLAMASNDYHIKKSYHKFTLSVKPHHVEKDWQMQQSESTP